MDTRRNEDAFLGLTLLAIWVFFLRSDRYVLTAVARKGPAESAPIDEVLREAITLNLSQIVAQV